MMTLHRGDRHCRRGTSWYRLAELWQPMDARLVDRRDTLVATVRQEIPRYRAQGVWQVASARGPPRRPT